MIIISILLLFIYQLTSALPYLAATVGADLPPEAIEIAESVAQQPFQGEATYQLGSVDSVYLIWGLGLGAYAFIASALARIIAGAVLRVTPQPEKKSEPAAPSPT